MIAVRGVQTIPGLAAVHGAEEPGVGNVDGVCVSGIGPDMREIPGALAEAVVVGNQCPVLTAVVGAIESPFFGFHERIDYIRIGAGNGHAAASERALGDALAFE